MNTKSIKTNSSSISSRNWTVCIIAIWITVFYSIIIQYKYIKIPNGMLILGIFVLGSYLFVCAQSTFNIDFMFTRESLWMIAFMLYMLPVGIITSPDINGHITQWITSCEYLFMMIVISSIIMHSGTDSFHVMLFIVAAVMTVIFLKSPVLYVAGGRYSISREVNPNGLGMVFTTGIWTVLFFQQKKKIPVLFTIPFIAAFLYCILKTGSRKALIAAGIIIFLWFAFCYFPKIMQKNNKWKIIILLFMALLIVFLVKEFTRLYTGSDIETRMEGLDNEISGGMRFRMYKNGWKIFLSNPLFGIGFQGFKFYHGGYSHATLVEVPVSGGIIGCVLYYASYFVSFKKCYRAYKKSRECEDSSVDISGIKMIIVLWAAMLFYCSCIIHPYQFNSFIAFGIVFGQSTFIEKKLQIERPESNLLQERKHRWIR